jgi:hypothetical protein
MAPGPGCFDLGTGRSNDRVAINSRTIGVAVRHEWATEAFMTREAVIIRWTGVSLAAGMVLILVAGGALAQQSSSPSLSALKGQLEQATRARGG